MFSTYYLQTLTLAWSATPLGGDEVIRAHIQRMQTHQQPPAGVETEG